MTAARMGGRDVDDTAARIHAGDRTEWNALIIPLLPRLRQFAEAHMPLDTRGMIGPDDVVQEAVLRGIRQLHRFEFRHSRAFLAYLLTSIRHRIVDEVRRTRRRPTFVPLGEHEHADQANSPLERIIAREDLACCAAAFARLGERDRQLIALRVQRRMRYADIAVCLDLSTSAAARMAVTRALNRLAKLLEREAESCAQQRACNPRS